MSDRTKLPKGWRLDTFPKNDGAAVVWVLFQALDDGRMCAVAGRDADSEGEAVEAARKVVEACSTPPVPPAWMVEVAREVCARRVEKDTPDFAAAYRCEDRDDAPVVDAAVLALRLALERGHVVERRETPPESFVSEDDPLFNPIWDVIKSWDIGDLAKYGGYCGATGDHVRAIIRAVRTIAVPTKAPEVDLEAALKRAWEAGFNATRAAVCELHYGKGVSAEFYDGLRHEDVRLILSTLPTREG